MLSKPDSWGSKLASDSYRVHKTFSADNFDVITIGDSRMEIAVSPEIVNKKLPELSVLNFGFSAAGLTRFYLNLAKSKLDVTGKKILIVGISPASLTEKFAKNEMLYECLNYSMYDRFVLLHFSSFIQYFDPIKPIDYYYSFKKMKKGRYESYSNSGWKWAEKFPRDSIALLGYKNSFDRNPISKEILDELIEFCEQMTMRGYSIIAFRIPSIAEMWELENSISGFDTLKIPDRIEKAGGIWLDFPSGDYQSFDASHMTKESAIKFSNQLADSIKTLRNSYY